MLRAECSKIVNEIMALFILSIFGLLATAALIWCLMGFSRALKEKQEMIGLLVRLRNNSARTTTRRKKVIIPFPDPRLRQTGAVRSLKRDSLNPLIVELLEMRKPHAS
jgi:hypothetical protein